MKLESVWILKVAAIVLVALTLIALDLALTGGEDLAGRHGSSF
jgi:hypothetical protein